MKLCNSTDFPDYVLRRLTSWCCKQIELSVRSVKHAQFRNASKYAYAGGAWGMRRFLTRIGPDSFFPANGSYAGVEMIFHDRIEALVGVTAHELYHLKQEREGLRRSRLERDADRAANQVLDVFRKQREDLLGEWMKAPKSRPKLKHKSVVERRAEAAFAKQALWQRKLKLAQTKLKKYKQKTRYYEQKLTRVAKHGPDN